MAQLADKRKFYIDGAWVEPSQKNDLEVIDPTTEEPVAVISLGSQADTDRAVAAAKAAFPAWSATPPASMRRDPPSIITALIVREPASMPA